jgi:DNA replicative helicase MCM subunit Mcm2 (Cdc46/Mcm family)
VAKQYVRLFFASSTGMDDVKRGLLCQLFGGQGKAFPGGRVRGEINVLLVRVACWMGWATTVHAKIW